MPETWRILGAAWMARIVACCVARLYNCWLAPNIDPVFALKTSPVIYMETQCVSTPGADQTGQSSTQISAGIGSTFSANQHPAQAVCGEFPLRRRRVVGRKNSIGAVKLPIGTHDVSRPRQVSRRGAWTVLYVNPLHVDMVLSGQDFDEAASDCSRRRIRQLFAASVGDQI